MSSLKAMPCISNSRAAILSCLARPQFPTHNPIRLSTLVLGRPTKIASHIGSIPARSLRWRSCCGKSFMGDSSKKRTDSYVNWGSESFRTDWGLSKVRTFASSPQRSDNSSDENSTQNEEQADATKILKKGFLVDAAEALEEKLDKPEICTADELHYVAVPGTKWRLALWRFRPPPDAPRRNHPVLMLSGIGTNAVGFDLDPTVSMARSISGAGFDTWILEVRGSGLSKSEEELADKGEAAETSTGALVENTAAPEDDKEDPSTKGSNEPTGEEFVDKGEAAETSTGALVENRAAPEDDEDPSTKGSNDPTGEETTLSETDLPTKVPSETSSEDGTVAKKDLPNQSSSGPISGSLEMAVASLGSLTKKFNEAKNGSVTEANSEDKMEVSQKSERGGTSWETWSTATKLTNLILTMSNKLSNLLSQGQSKSLSARFVDSIVNILEESTLSKRATELRERLAKLLETQQNSSVVMHEMTELRKKLAQLLGDGQGVVRPRVTDLQERLNNTVDDFQKIVDLIAKYDWDFDDYLDEDVPTAMEYVRNQCKPVDGKVLSVGHSMGGIVLYALLSKRGNESGLVGAVALASALDYQCSDTSLKLLLPLTDPAQVLNVPVVPLGALMTAIHPLVTRPPYALAWLGYQVSAQNMMKPELFSKLALNNFGTIPVKLLLHLCTVFQPGGLASRDGTFKYKQNIGKVTVPVLAIAGDQDLICPPVAVLDTVDLFPKDIVTYKCFGGENKRHYGHYDLVCSPGAKEEVFPVIVDFLLQHDAVKMQDAKSIELEV